MLKSTFKTIVKGSIDNSDEIINIIESQNRFDNEE